MASNDTSHAEIWDDSLLIDSWNEALEEYKYYHSIHARGEKVEDALKEAEDPKATVGDEAEYEEGEVNDEQVDDQHPKDEIPQVDSTHQATEQASGKSPKGPTLPQHLVGQVHDESLKNLLMSWYYAGYYTGLYEGQQQGATGKQA